MKRHVTGFAATVLAMIRTAVVAAVLACLPLITLAATQSAGKAQPPAFTFGIVPQQAPSKMLRSWGPVLRLLEQRSGYRFVFRTAPNIPVFEERLAAGDYDFAYMNPYHFTVFNNADQGFQALVKAKDKQIRGIMVVRQDSTLRTLADLQGAALAFPAPTAFAASVLPRAHLKAEGIDFEARYVASHDSVYKSVAKGLFAAGGGVLRTFQASDATVREQLRVLWTTPGYTPHAIAVHARVAHDLAAAVQRVLLGLTGDETGRAVLNGLKVDGFESATNADWDDVRALRIETRLDDEK